MATGNLKFNKALLSMTCIDYKLYTYLNSSICLKKKSLLILWSPLKSIVASRSPMKWEEGPMTGLASQLLNKLLWWSKQLIGWLILGIFRLTAICTTAIVADSALQTSVQTQNFIQNWTKDAHTIWVTQVQIDEKVQDKIQRLETAIQWVGGQ